MKLIKAATFSECNSCGARKRESDEVYGCDQCAKPIDLANPKARRHDVTVFFDVDANQSFYFCSVSCVVRWLKSFRPSPMFRFMSLPLFSGVPTIREFQKHLRTVTK